MTPDEFKAIRAAAGLSHQQMADFLGVTWRSIYRYEAGERAITKPIEKLLERL